MKQTKRIWGNNKTIYLTYLCCNFGTRAYHHYGKYTIIKHANVRQFICVISLVQYCTNVE